MGHASLKAIGLVVRQHNIGAATVMALTAEEKAAANGRLIPFNVNVRPPRLS